MGQNLDRDELLDFWLQAYIRETKLLILTEETLE